MSLLDEKKEQTEQRSEQRNEGLSTSSFAGIGERPAQQGGGDARVAAASEEQSTPLFSENDTRELRAQWDSIQASFIDEPRRAVEQADNLVAAAMKRMAQMFANERSKLEGQWDRGDDVSTEDLRVTLRRYRSFFNRLLNM
jgi:hypothetical protein